VAFEERIRCSIPGRYFLPPTSFTPEEALLLVALANELGCSQRLPFYEPAKRAAHKVECVRREFALPQGFSPERYLKNAWQVIPGEGRTTGW
jgi:hypothetical protein